MKKVTVTEGGREIVVFDEIVTTRPGGVNLLDTGFADRFPDEDVIPAGTAIVQDGDDFVIAQGSGEGGAIDLADGLIGLLAKDTPVEDYNLVAVVTGGTVRVDALPELEAGDWEELKEALPTLIKY